MTMRIYNLLAATMILVAGSVAPALAGKTLDAIKARDKVRCSVNTDSPGWAAPDSQGVWRGMDVDMCKAMAAAVFGDANKIELVRQNFAQIIPSLQSGEVDIATRSITWTVSRETALGLDFPAVHFISGQGFMVPKKLNITKPEELNGATICVHAGSTTEANLNDFFKERNLTYKQALFEDQSVLYAAYEAGRCDAVSNEPPQLAARRSVFKSPGDHMILNGVISKEPYSVAIRQGDDEWRKIVRMTIYALINAEEFGIDSKNVKQRAESTKNAEQRRFLGVEGEIGTKMGLKNTWVQDIITQVGNYGEMFDRNLGANSPLKMDRGMSAVWTKGGMLFAPPWR